MPRTAAAKQEPAPTIAPAPDAPVKKRRKRRHTNGIGKLVQNAALARDAKAMTTGIRRVRQEADIQVQIAELLDGLSAARQKQIISSFTRLVS